jgi:hypothetical protein
MKMIFAHSPVDPQSKTGPLEKHAQRGSAEINFFQNSAPAPVKAAEPVVQQLNLTMNDFQIPGLAETEYFCRFIKLPTFPRKLHAVSVSASIGSISVPVRKRRRKNE